MTANCVWIYKLTEPGVYTVGFYDPNNGKWHTDSDHGTKGGAGSRAAFLNGARPDPDLVAALEAAQVAAEYFNAWCPENQQDTAKAIYQQVRAALRKARGE